MYDALMLAAIVDELNDRLLDGKVQRVLLLDPLTIGFEVYADGTRQQLLVSADARDPRMHLVGGANGAGRLTGDAARVTPLLLLLRKYVRGARLVRIYQESPLERVAFLRFAKFIPHDLAHATPTAPDPANPASPEDPDEPDDDDTLLDGDLMETTLAIEIMGRHSNLVLLDSDNLIMDSAKRVPSRLSRVRQILPKLPYTPVPPQDKADPRTIPPHDLAALLTASSASALHNVLVGGLRGVSPQIAREVAFRATGSTRTKAADALPHLDALRRAFDDIYAPLRTAAWAPRLYSESAVGSRQSVADGSGESSADSRQAPPTSLPPISPLPPPLMSAAEATDPSIFSPPSPSSPPLAFSPLPLLHLAALHEEPVGSVSALVERFFGATARVQAHGQRKDTLANTIGQERERLVGRERALLIEAKRAEEAERWRRWGEAIYAHAWTLEPGQRELVADDLTVPLDPARTPSENAQDYFERYRKAQGAAANVPALLETTRNGLAYLDQLLTLLHLAERYDQIAALDREWQDWLNGRYHPPQGHDADAQPHQQQRHQPGGQRQRNQPRGRGTPPSRPQTLRARGGHQIFIGHTSAQNDAVTFDIAGQEDTWLHSRGVPGSHVVIKWSGGRADDTILQAAAALAAYYSGGRESGRVEVDHAARRDVRKIKGAGPGMVTYRNERTLRVAPRAEDDLRRDGLIE